MQIDVIEAQNNVPKIKTLKIKLHEIIFQIAYLKKSHKTITHVFDVKIEAISILIKNNLTFSIHSICISKHSICISMHSIFSPIQKLFHFKMNQSNFTTQSGLTFLLNTNNFTTIVFDTKDAAGDIYIPYSINYNNQDYLITSIGPKSFFHNKKIKSISFPDNSEVKSIGSSAFFESSMITLNIPKSLTKIEDRAFSFSDLAMIEIPSDSQLEIIEEFAFSNTKITKFTIPSKLRELCLNIFNECKSLKVVDYHPNSELYSIGAFAFAFSGIETLKIPPFLEQLNGSWCERTDYLKNIIISPKNKNFCFSDGKYLYGKSNKDSELYDILYFVNRETEEVIIPKYVKIIGKNAISHCKKNKNIKIQ